MPRDKQLESMVEEAIVKAEQEEEGYDDLTRGTEIYEEIDDEVEEYADDPQELDFEPALERNSNDFDSDLFQDAYIGEDD